MTFTIPARGPPLTTRCTRATHLLNAMNTHYPQRPARGNSRFQPCFRSRRLGRMITSADLPHLDDADLAAVRQEVEHALAAVKRDLALAQAGPRTPAHQFAELKARRIECGALHQAMLRFLKDARTAAQRAAQADGAGGTDVAAYFQRVARRSWMPSPTSGSCPRPRCAALLISSVPARRWPRVSRAKPLVRWRQTS